MTAKISGIVTDLSGTPLNVATVKITLNGLDYLTLTTDTKGAYEAAVTEAGLLMIYVSATGYKPQFFGGTFSAEQQGVANFMLHSED